jgi:hypothetical protein
MSIVVLTLASAGLVSLSRAPWDSFPRGRGPLPGSAVARPLRPAPLQRDDDDSGASVWRASPLRRGALPLDPGPLPSSASSDAALRTATATARVRALAAGLRAGRGRKVT